MCSKDPLLIINGLSFDEEIEERRFDAGPDQHDDDRDGDSRHADARDIRDGELPFFHAEREGARGARIGSCARQRNADEQREAHRPVFFNLRFQFTLCTFEIFFEQDVDPMDFAAEVRARRDQCEDQPADDDVGHDAGHDGQPQRQDVVVFERADGNGRAKFEARYEREGDENQNGVYHTVSKSPPNGRTFF